MKNQWIVILLCIVSLRVNGMTPPITTQLIIQQIFAQLYEDIQKDVIDITKISNDLFELFYNFASDEEKEKFKKGIISNRPYQMGMRKILEETQRRLKTSPSRRKQEEQQLKEYYKETQEYLSRLTLEDLVCAGCSEQRKKNPSSWEIKGENAFNSKVNEFLTRKEISNQAKAQFAQNRVDTIVTLVMWNEKAVEQRINAINKSSTQEELVAAWDEFFENLKITGKALSVTYSNGKFMLTDGTPARRELNAFIEKSAQFNQEITLDNADLQKILIEIFIWNKTTVEQRINALESSTTEQELKTAWNTFLNNLKTTDKALSIEPSDTLLVLADGTLPRHELNAFIEKSKQWPQQTITLDNTDLQKILTKIYTSLAKEKKEDLITEWNMFLKNLKSQIPLIKKKDGLLMLVKYTSARNELNELIEKAEQLKEQGITLDQNIALNNADLQKILTEIYELSKSEK